MTLSEFKAWFEGFTEILEGPPDAKQWKRIQARVKEITGNPIPERVFIDRWRGLLPYDPRPYRAYYSAGACTAQNGVGHTASNAAAKAAAKADGVTEVHNLVNGRRAEFDSHRALYAAGILEAKNLAS